MIKISKKYYLTHNFISLYLVIPTNNNNNSPHRWWWVSCRCCHWQDSAAMLDSRQDSRGTLPPWRPSVARPWLESSGSLSTATIHAPSYNDNPPKKNFKTTKSRTTKKNKNTNKNIREERRVVNPHSPGFTVGLIGWGGSAQGERTGRQLRLVCVCVCGISLHSLRRDETIHCTYSLWHRSSLFALELLTDPEAILYPSLYYKPLSLSFLLHFLHIYMNRVDSEQRPTRLLHLYIIIWWRCVADSNLYIFILDFFFFFNGEENVMKNLYSSEVFKQWTCWDSSSKKILYLHSGSYYRTRARSLIFKLICGIEIF